MVVDTSALLAVWFREPEAAWVSAQLTAHRDALVMSTVNLTETLLRVRDHFGADAEVVEQALLRSGIRYVPPDVEQARSAARARLSYPLNLGDCFAYVLAVHEGVPILTLDRDFRTTGHPLVMP